jgi:hypothetical protein
VSQKKDELPYLSEDFNYLCTKLNGCELATKLPNKITSSSKGFKSKLLTRGALSQQQALDTIYTEKGSADVLPWNKFRLQQVQAQLMGNIYNITMNR